LLNARGSKRLLGAIQQSIDDLSVPAGMYDSNSKSGP
jgi:hypothetical protein